MPASTTTGSARQTLVWLPPQYDQPQFSHTKFPVLMVLPGQPSTPEAMFRHYNFGAIAAAEITARRIPPFVAVFPPLMTHPPRDTECTNISHGPQAETWLVRDVHQAVTNQLRTAPTPWASIGWSTGAFCSAKLLLKHHNLYSAAVGLGGYYQPITDKTTGDLFHRDPTARQQNSPLWLYQHGGLHQRKLLFIYGQQDHEARKATTKMLTATRGDPDVSSLAFPTGGHNYRNYRTYLPDALRWLHSAGALV